MATAVPQAIAVAKALDHLRGEGRSAEREAAVAELAELMADDTGESIPDDRLRLFLDLEPTMGQRLSRGRASG